MNVGLRLLRVVVATALSCPALGCSAADDPELLYGDEPVASVGQAVEAAIDKKPVAAVFVPDPNGPGSIWVFARGLNNTLARRIYHLEGFWETTWWTYANDIVDIPSVALYGEGEDVSVVLYARATDNEIWELYFPGPNPDNVFSWYQVTQHVTDLDIRGAPAVASDGWQLTVLFVAYDGNTEQYELNHIDYNREPHFNKWTPGYRAPLDFTEDWTSGGAIAVDQDSAYAMGRRGYRAENRAVIYRMNGLENYQGIVNSSDDPQSGTMAIDVQKLSDGGKRIHAFARQGGVICGNRRIVNTEIGAS